MSEPDPNPPASPEPAPEPAAQPAAAPAACQPSAASPPTASATPPASAAPSETPGACAPSPPPAAPEPPAPAPAAGTPGPAAPGTPALPAARSPAPRPRRPLPKDYKLRLTALGACAVLLVANIVLGIVVLTSRRQAPAPPPQEPPVPARGVVPPSALEGGGYADMKRLPELRAMMEKLRPLHQKIHKPGPIDWLTHHKEPGQTFAEYLRCEPVTLSASRKTICIQPLGEFTGTQRKIVLLAGEYMARYFSAEISVMEDLPLEVVPASARRGARGVGPQIKTPPGLSSVLAPRLPNDPAADNAVTALDLYPQDSWNFCFGQASLRERVGVWSLARYGDPDSSPEAFRLCLLRTLKVATHETGHMFSMYHCVLCECNMNGSNHMAESDAKPLWLCPECLAKVLWATGADPVGRYKKLAAFCAEQGLKEEQQFFEKSLEVLQKP